MKAPDLVIETLADSEAELDAQHVSGLADLLTYRELFRYALHHIAALDKQVRHSDALNARLLAELRALKRARKAGAS